VLVREDACALYLSNVAELIERHGISLTRPGPGESLELVSTEKGLAYELIGLLPHSGGPPPQIEVRESLAPIGGGWYRTSGYEFELIDPSRSHRRAFHFHDAPWFVDRYQVAVHQHCERPLGHVRCEHYASSPVKDAYAGVTILMAAWIDGPIDCRALDCLD
jgi:hypothetical protein